MKVFVTLIAVLAVAQLALALPAQKQELAENAKLDLSTIMNLLPSGTNTNILGSLTHLTQGTSLGTVMNLISLLNTVHQFTQNLQAIPQDIMHALNSTLTSLGASTDNITALINHMTIGGHSKLDLSTIMNLLPSGTNTNILGSLTHLTQGTSLGTIMNLISLLNTVHQFTQNLQAIPQDIMHALNTTLTSLGAATDNITGLINQMTGSGHSKLDLSTIMNLLPSGTNTNILGSLTHLTQGTSLGTVMNLISLLNTVHQFTQNLQAIPQDIMHALNTTLTSLGATTDNITALINHMTVGGHSKLDLSTIMNLLPSGTNTNILGSLTHLTQGTSLGTIMNLISLLNTVHQFTQNLQAIPQDIMHALNSTLTTLGATTDNITGLINQMTGSGHSKLDLTQLLPQGTSIESLLSLLSLLGSSYQYTTSYVQAIEQALSALGITTY